MMFDSLSATKSVESATRQPGRLRERGFVDRTVDARLAARSGVRNRQAPDQIDDPDLVRSGHRNEEQAAG